MSIQTTFRAVAKPRVKVLTSALAGGQLPLDGATVFAFAGAAVGTVTSLLGYEYLIDGQQVNFSNAHPTNSLTITIGAFSKVIPAGYSLAVLFDSANASFYPSRKHADLKPIEDSVAANAAAIAQEISDRQGDTALLYKLDGSRPLTGDMDLAGFFLNNLPAALNGDQAVNKSQLDTIVAALQAAISSSSTSLSWRPKVNYISKFVSGSIPANNDALVDSNFGAGNNRLFEDDQAGTQATVASIAVDSTVVFLKSGVEPKLMVVRDVLGTKRWFDHTEANAALKIDRAIVAGDTFIVEMDLLAGTDAQETQAIYHIEAGTPKVALKIGDLDWEAATGISIAAGYTRGAGGATVVTGDSVQAAVEKLDGNIELNKTDAATALSTAIATEVSDRNSAISSAIATEVSDRNAAILSSQNAQDAKLASVAAAEGASLVGVNDVDGLYAATTVESALKEARLHINTAETDIVALETDVADHTTQIGQNTSDISALENEFITFGNELASTSVGLGASMIGIHDANGDFTATTVEGALAELDAKVDGLNLVNLKRGLFEVATTGATSLNLSTNFVDQLSGGVVQDLSSATYMNAMVNRDGAMLIGGVGYTISGSTITFTTAGGGQLVAGEVLEIKIIEIN
jgi:hypothetical protein